jgi:hypothetical protein
MLNLKQKISSFLSKRIFAKEREYLVISFSDTIPFKVDSLCQFNLSLIYFYKIFLTIHKYEEDTLSIHSTKYQEAEQYIILNCKHSKEFGKYLVPILRSYIAGVELDKNPYNFFQQIGNFFTIKPEGDYFFTISTMRKSPDLKQFKIIIKK